MSPRGGGISLCSNRSMGVLHIPNIAKNQRQSAYLQVPSHKRTPRSSTGLCGQRLEAMQQIRFEVFKAFYADAQA